MKTKDLVSLAEEIISEAFPEHTTDKGGVPYIKHLLIVREKAVDKATNLFRIKDRDTINLIAATALLHDLLEDCPEWDEDRLLKVITLKEVVEAVTLLTKKPEQSYQTYIDSIAGNKIATVVKIADLSHNLDASRLTELAESDIARLKKYHTTYWKLIQEYKLRYL